MATKKHLSSDVIHYISKLDEYFIKEVDGPDDYLRLKVFSSRR